MAWVFDRYVKDRSLYPLQDAARSSRLGLWADAEQARQEAADERRNGDDQIRARDRTERGWIRPVRVPLGP